MCGRKKDGKGPEARRGQWERGRHRDSEREKGRDELGAERRGERARSK